MGCVGGAECSVWFYENRLKHEAATAVFVKRAVVSARRRRLGMCRRSLNAFTTCRRSDARLPTRMDA